MPPHAEAKSEKATLTPLTCHLLQSLGKSLATGDEFFSCGGTIPIAADNENEPTATATTAGPVAASPIALRWDAHHDIQGPVLSKDTKLIFPLEPTTEANLSKLIQNMEKATFGRGGEDVFDEEYRKALKMDTTAFCSNFNPYELGIIDTIAQVLLPSVKDSTRLRAVKAELYKLNIYSGPSGKFKPHVDTPRSNNHFGSLVVCFPLEHQGGQLQVHHNGKEITFDWSNKKTDAAAIHWAAFYSDCEHEVLQVTSGHRLTLTYNLYAVRGTGRLAGHCPTLRPTEMPLYRTIESMLRETDFLPLGGKLGFFCAHAYAYTDPHETPMPDVLKGSDMVLFEILRALGLQPRTRAVMWNEEWAFLYSQGREHEMDEEEEQASASEYNSEGEDKPKEKPEAELWMNEYTEQGYSIGKLKGCYASAHFEVYFAGNVEQDGKEVYNKDWASEDGKDIVWLTLPTHERIQMAYLGYGNQGTITARYSHCGIIVDIPVPSNRKLSS